MIGLGVAMNIGYAAVLLGALAAPAEDRLPYGRDSVEVRCWEVYADSLIGGLDPRLARHIHLSCLGRYGVEAEELEKKEEKPVLEVRKYGPPQLSDIPPGLKDLAERLDNWTRDGMFLSWGYDHLHVETRDAYDSEWDSGEVLLPKTLFLVKFPAEGRL